LHEHVQQAGLKSHLLSFPRYADTLFGRGIADFLNGRFGRLAEVDPFLVSLLYAGDRFESKELLRRILADNDVVVLDRYVSSNIAHQASKRDGAERAELVRWIEQIEYGIYGLPRPDLIFLLDMPPAQAQKLVALKAARNYTDRAADIQEADSEHLRRTRDMYLELAAGHPEWRAVACCCGTELRSVADIAAEIWAHFESARPTSR
jgi:dTMP kinase